MKSTRRQFLITSLGAASALALSREALAEAPIVSESDPVARVLGYKANATKVDRAKYPGYVVGQTCGNCMYYQGSPTDVFAPCPLLGSKRVAGKGWCNAYVEKAGGMACPGM